MTVTVSSAAWDAMLAAAAADAGSEACGLLLGEGDAVATALPAANVAAEPWHRFEVDPAVLFAARRAARGGGPAVLGCYHSHPSGVGLPSAVDAGQIGRAGELWLIVAAGRLHGWRATADAQGFEPVALACVAESPRPKRGGPKPDGPKLDGPKHGGTEKA